MKKISAFILLLAFSMQTFSQGIVIINFYIHQSYIAATQCENRYRPMLHCNGKCQLAKKLQQQEHKEQQNPELKLENKNEAFSSGSFFIASLPPMAILSFFYSFLRAEKTVERPGSIFHPPC